MISVIAGMVLTTSIIKDKHQVTQRDEFNEMQNEYVGKQYIFPI
ncbi:MAG: hypothetical protein AB7T10_08320 [bacterium]